MSGHNAATAGVRTPASAGPPIPHIEIFRRHSGRLFNHADIYFSMMCENGLLDGCESVLSIGGGEGQLEVRLAAERGIRIGYVDPDPGMAREFARRVTKAGVAGLLVEQHVDRFQNVASNHSYDLALSIYSWFSMGYDRGMIQKVFERLEVGGHFLVVAPSATDPLRLAVGRKPHVVAEEFSDWAHGRGLGHRFFIHTAFQPLVPGDLIVDGTLSEAAHDLVMFRAGRRWPELRPAERARIVDVLRRAEAAGRLARVSGCLVFEKP